MASLLRQRQCISVALGQKDAYTEAHCTRVERLALELGSRCGLGRLEQSLLRTAARLHDVGKIGIPEQVLLKPGRLTPDEYEVIKRHCEYGQLICEALAHEHAGLVALVIRHHHEQFDGLGYPDGLAGQDIPICARLISVVDCYDAMTSRRSYRGARSHQETMGILQDECGSKSDPSVFAHFASLVQGRPDLVASSASRH